MIEILDLSVTLGGREILSNVNFTVQDNEWLMIVGPNGAGKSTIVNAVSQSIPYTGTIRIDGIDARTMKARTLARKLGVLTQNHYVGYGFTVEEVIRLGCYSHGGLFSNNREYSAERFREAVEKTGMEPYLSQSILTLSGGELQRTFLAQLFAQDPELLILDEPTNHLDLNYQRQVFELVADWQRMTGRAVLSVVHDLSLAKRYGSHALLLDHGTTAAYGASAEVLVPDKLNRIYSMDVAGWMRSLYGIWN